jgi:hypothetical protein
MKRSVAISGALVALWFSIAIRSSSQTPSQNANDPVPPDDAKAILLAASNLNGLDSPGLRPWHILVSYDRFDEDGDNDDSGTYEEYWASPKQYRRVFSSHDFNQTDVSNDQGIYRSGAQQWPGVLQTRVRDDVVRPMFRELNLDYADPEKTLESFGAAQLPCVLLRAHLAPGAFRVDKDLPGFCFENKTLILRFIRGGMSWGTTWHRTILSKIVRFQSRYVARDIQINDADKLFLKITVETIEELPELPPATLVPPADAKLLNLSRITIEPQVLTLDYLLHQDVPSYPSSIPPPEGDATAKIVIGKDGRVVACEILEASQPKMRQPLQDAILKSVFRPYVVRGEPVEVETTEKFVYMKQGR